MSEELDQIVERLQKERLASGKSFFLSRPDPLREGDCSECGGMGEIKVHATLFECRHCQGTGREDFEPKEREYDQILKRSPASLNPEGDSHGIKS